MISLFVKSTIAFVLSYFILTIPLNGKTFFYHLTQITGPVGNVVTMHIKDGFSYTIDKSRKLGKQLFTNSAPPSEGKHFFQDELSKKQSALKKKYLNYKAEKDIAEEIEHADTQALDKVIEDNQSP